MNHEIYAEEFEEWVRKHAKEFSVERDTDGNWYRILIKLPKKPKSV